MKTNTRTLSPSAQESLRIRAVKAVLAGHTQVELNLPFYLWTREAVGRLIEDRFGIPLSVWTVGRYLAQWGFTPQKPARRALARDPERVRRGVGEEYPAIRSRAKREGAEM